MTGRWVLAVAKRKLRRDRRPLPIGLAEPSLIRHAVIEGQHGDGAIPIGCKKGLRRAAMDSAATDHTRHLKASGGVAALTNVEEVRAFGHAQVDLCIFKAEPHPIEFRDYSLGTGWPPRSAMR